MWGCWSVGGGGVIVIPVILTLVAPSFRESVFGIECPFIYFPFQFSSLEGGVWWWAVWWDRSLVVVAVTVSATVILHLDVPIFIKILIPIPIPIMLITKSKSQPPPSVLDRPERARCIVDIVFLAF